MTTKGGRRKKGEAAREAAAVIALLHRWGLHTVGQFAALKRDEVSDRLGPAAVRLWERACGRTTRVLRLVRPPESFRESHEFEQEIETVEPLLFILRRFLEQLMARLGGLHVVVGELELQLRFADKSVYDHLFKVPEPTGSVEVLFRMLHAHLEDFKSEHPITAVSLEARPVAPAPQQFGLFETTLRRPGQLYETLARLTGLLGADRVGTPVPRDTHRPDAFAMRPFSWTTPDDPGPAEKENEEPWPASCALRRFRRPVPATVIMENAQPRWLRQGAGQKMIRDRRGPYPFSGDWWDREAWDRVEWDFALADGTIWRCHREPDGRWLVDGLYD